MGNDLEEFKNHLKGQIYNEQLNKLIQNIFIFYKIK